jgi:hypothetical protein
MRAAAKALAGVALVAAAWSGIFLYWHVRILRAVRDLERESLPSHRLSESITSDAGTVIVKGGCRSLPYMIESLDASKSPDFLCACSTLVCWQSVHPGVLPAESDSMLLSNRLDDWCISIRDDAALRRRKCDLVKAWWREHGSEHHQWWRVWSSSCGSP